MRAIQILAILLVAAVQGQGQFEENALAAHNAARANHMNTEALTWNADAAKHAQDWCNQLVEKDSFGHSSGSGYGENLYWSSQILTDGSVWGTAAVTSWYAEKQFWNYDTSTGSSGKVTGHFTQVVWQSSTGVGCGFAANPNGGTYPNGYKGTFVCCNYSPPGNYRGQYADNVAPLNPTCEWKWMEWESECLEVGVAGTCSKKRQQGCSCNDESQCDADQKMADEFVACTCPVKCEWEWGGWGECAEGNCMVNLAGTCCQGRKQECSCADSTKCDSSWKMVDQTQQCTCEEEEEEEKCEWKWADWGDCSAADTVGVCHQARQQECSCSDDAKCDTDQKMDKEFQECTCEEEEEKCEWKWSTWGECSEWTDGTCHQARKQECSCSDESKCAATEKMPDDSQTCDCEEQCEWEWTTWSDCNKVGTSCYRFRKQSCSCGSDDDCIASDREEREREMCDTCEEETCEWEWGKWSKCTDKDPAADVQTCVKTREQECSCMSTDSTTETCVEGDKKAAETEECGCGEDDYEVRLMGSDMKDCGVLAIGSEEKNYTKVCDDWWGDKESNTACRHMGFKWGSSVALYDLMGMDGFVYPWDKLGAFGTTETTCPPLAQSLDDCKNKEYLSEGTSPCSFKEAVALKCCDTKYTWEITQANTKCSKKKCKFAASLTLEKKCLDVDFKNAKVEVWTQTTTGTAPVSVATLKYHKRKAMFVGKAKIQGKSSDDCFIYKASIEGFGGVMKSSGGCKAKEA